MKQGKIQRAFTYLESGSVLLVTTNDGTADNVMTISWQMVMDFTPRIAISTGAWNESFETILKNKECCLCIPHFGMLDQVVGIGTVHGSECDKFEQFGLLMSWPTLFSELADSALSVGRLSTPRSCGWVRGRVLLSSSKTGAGRAYAIKHF